MDFKKIKKVATKALKFLGIAVLSISVVLFSSVPFQNDNDKRSFSVSDVLAGKCCSVVSVSNFGELIGMVSEKVTSVIVSTLVSQFAVLIAHLERESKYPGQLRDWEISELQKVLEKLHLESYDQLVSQIQENVNPQKWIEIATNNPSAIVPPIVAYGGSSYGSFSDFGAFVQGDLSVVYKTFDTLDRQNLDPILEKNLRMRIRELESAKVALSQEVAEIGATAKKLETLNKQLNDQLKKIDVAQKEGDYKEEQAVKDLIKVQMLQTYLLTELLRNQLNQESVLIAQYNQKLAEERNKILSDLMALHTKVSGKWTVPKR